MALRKRLDACGIEVVAWTTEMHPARPYWPGNELDRTNESVTTGKDNDLSPMLRCKYGCKGLTTCQQRIADEACWSHLNKAADKAVVTISPSTNRFRWRNSPAELRDKPPKE